MTASRSHMVQNLDKKLRELADKTQDEKVASQLRIYAEAAASLLRSNKAQAENLRRMLADNQSLRGIRQMIEAEL